MAHANDEKKILAKFLRLYKESPCLWDRNHEFYSNRKKREQAYGVLLETFKEIQENANVETVKRKIDYMRTSYNRERRRVNQSLTDYSNKQHVPTLWYYNLIKFIDGYDDDEDSSCNLPTEFPEHNDEDCDASSSKKVKTEVSLQFLPEIEYDDDASVNNLGSQDHEAISFGRTIGLQLKDLEPQQRFIAEKLISEVIFYGRLEKLNTQSQVALNEYS